MRSKLLLLLGLAVLAPASVRAQGSALAPAAQAHLDAALAAYNAKDYPTAIREFDLAYAIDPKPALLYATAQAHRFAGNCTEALRLYDQYLETKPNETQVKATAVGVKECEAKLPPPVVTPPSAPPPPVDVPVITTPPVAPVIVTPPEGRASPWYKDPIGGSLTAVGVVGIGVGVTFLVMAGSSQDRADTAEFRDDFMQALDEATSRRRIGGVLVTAGGVLAVSGIMVYVLRDRGGDRAVVGGTDGRSLYVAGRF